MFVLGTLSPYPFLRHTPFTQHSPLKIIASHSLFSCITPFKLFYMIPFITLPDSQSTVLIHHTNSPWPLPWRYLFPATNIHLHSHLHFDETNFNPLVFFLVLLQHQIDHWFCYLEWLSFIESLRKKKIHVKTYDIFLIKKPFLNVKRILSKKSLVKAPSFVKRTSPTYIILLHLFII